MTEGDADGDGHRHQNGEPYEGCDGVLENLLRIKFLLRARCVLGNRCDAVAADQVDVNHDQQHGERRQQQHVRRVEAREGHRADGSAVAAEQSQNVRARARRERGDLRRDHGAPIGAIVPGQKVSGEAVSQGDQQQDAAHHPGGLARFFIRAPDKHLHQVQHDDDDHKAAPSDAGRG